MRQVFEYLMAAYPVEEAMLIDAAARGKPQEGEVLMQTVAEQLHERGKAEGIRIGREEGKAEGKAEGEKLAAIRAVVRALDRRFGPLSPDITARVENTPPEALDDLFDLASIASTLEEVFQNVAPH